MYTVSLISAKNPSLRQQVELLQHKWHGDSIKWLALDEAAEFEIADAVEHHDLWVDLQQQGIDLVVQRSAKRKKQLLLADMDSTMIEQECIDELAAEAGVGQRVAAITARAMNGEIDFDGALNERVLLLKGLSESVIEAVFDQRISFMPGGRCLVQTMKANGAYAALVSGGFTAFTTRVSAALGFDHSRANQLQISNHKLTGQVIPPILGREAKVQALNELCAERGITLDDALAVGDGANDLGMLQAAGAGVALHAKPSVQAQAQHVINHGDLTALLYLQGYSKTEFVD